MAELIASSALIALAPSFASLQYAALPAIGRTRIPRLFLITLLILLCSGPVYAEWVKVSSNDDAGATIYVDPATVRRKGDLVKMWILWDSNVVRTVEGVSFSSVKRQDQFDCAEERQRLLAAAEFSGNMGNGNIVFSHTDEQKWQPIMPETINQALWKFACGKE